ncbi:MAG: HEAT repeat domain-containing protein, partial [Promethearchaeota archaeon]
YLGLFRDLNCFEIFENLLISDENLQIKCEAAKALGRLNDKRGLKPLKWILEKDSIDNEVKMHILRAIASIRFEDPEIELFIKQ